MTHPVPHEVVIFVLLVVLALAVAFIARRLRVTYTLALVLTGLAIGALHLLPTVQLNANLVLFVFLPALLFDGAWNIETAALRADWLAILLLAVPGLLVSLVVVAAVVHWGAGLPLLAALLLGAIVSPTDPIAVLALLRRLGMPERLCSIIEGESLFNDGVGAAAFDLVLGALLLSLHQDGALAGLPATLVVLKGLWLLLGGLALGGAVGFAVSHVVRVVDDPLLETTVTFSVAYGAYILATALGTSGLLSVVGAGLVLGSYGRRIGMAEPTRAVVDTVWQFTGYLANSLLFLLVGIEIGSASLLDELPTIAWAVLGVLLGRAVVVYTLLPLHDAIKRWRGAHISGDRPHAFGWLPVPPLWRPLILFSGLRGALSLALVISLPPSVPLRQPLTLAVYGVVLVTLVGQTIGLRLVIPRWPRV
ncbi:MAG TPA: cation:proton antiporter [Ktedonobacterales bacterium]|nr:cation:proton antiporter [Ktedonobacterales bacterium]